MNCYAELLEPVGAAQGDWQIPAGSLVGVTGLSDGPDGSRLVSICYVHENGKDVGQATVPELWLRKVDAIEVTN